MHTSAHVAFFDRNSAGKFITCCEEPSDAPAVEVVVVAASEVVLPTAAFWAAASWEADIGL